jgi:hypothetical protein
MSNDPLLVQAVNLLNEVETLIHRDLDRETPVTWGVKDALSEVMDARSDLAGEIAARLPDYPLADRDALPLTKREVLG